MDLLRVMLLHSFGTETKIPRCIQLCDEVLLSYSAPRPYRKFMNDDTISCGTEPRCTFSTRAFVFGLPCKGC